MSEHAWVLENLASYVADGLDADECEQLEQHTANCPACACSLDEIRAVDRRLGALFADVQPNPVLEDRSIRALREVTSGPGGWQLSRKGKAVLVAAAAIFLAVVGAGASVLIEEEQISFPGTAKNNLKELALGVDLTGGTIGVHQRGQLYSPHDGTVSDLLDPDTLAKKLREKSYAGPIHGHIHHGADIPSTVTDGDSAAGKPDAEMNYSMDGKAGGSVPGIVNPNEPTGILPPPNLAPQSPPVTNGGSSATNYYKITGGVGDRKRGKASGESNHPGDPERSYFKPGADFNRTTPPSGGSAPGNSPPREPEKKEDEASKRPKSSQGRGDTNGELANKDGKGKEEKQPAKPEEPAPGARKIIRSGDIEFEVESFDAAVSVVLRLVSAGKGGFIATINSEKLPNGKVRGSVVVRVPPEQLDGFVLDLRKELGKAGELKGQRIGSQDITKQYTDLESRLRASRTMEERLLKIIQEGKGQIKDLLQAEKELGVWRTKVEELEGELRYYANMVALSTLTVTLAEKEIRTAAVVAESERVQAGIEVEDVDKAMREALDAVADAKGRVTRSELKQHAAGQFSVLLHFEVEPAAAGPLRDRLRQLGTMVRLEIDRVQQAEGGVLAPHDGKIKRGPTQFFVSLYNLANVAPRETVTLKVAAPDVPAAFRKLREAVGKAGGRVVNAQLSEQDRQNVTAQLDFDVRRADEGVPTTTLAEAGEVLSRHVSRVPEGENVTDAKVLFKVELVQADAIPPRETATLALEVADVEATLAVLSAQVKEAHGRSVQTQIGQEKSGRVTAHVLYDVPLASALGLVEKAKSSGTVRVQQVARNPQAPEGRLALARLDVTLSNAELLVPSEAGLWAQVRNGLSFSLRGLSLSASWLIVGVLFVLPWVLLLYAVVWLTRRLWGSEVTPATSGPVSSGTVTPGN